MWASSKSHLPHQGVDFPVLGIDHLRCPAHLLELRIARPGPPLLGELPVEGPGLGDLVKQSGVAHARMRPDASCI